MTVIVPPYFGMSSNVDYLRVSVPYSVNIFGKCLNNSFKSINTWYGISTESLDQADEFFDEVSFLFTVLG